MTAVKFVLPFLMIFANVVASVFNKRMSGGTNSFKQKLSASFLYLLSLLVANYIAFTIIWLSVLAEKSNTDPLVVVQALSKNSNYLLVALISVSDLVCTFLPIVAALGLLPALVSKFISFLKGRFRP